MTYTIETLTVHNTWQPWMTGIDYHDACDLCYAVISHFEMEVCRIAEETSHGNV